MMLLHISLFFNFSKLKMDRRARIGSVSTKTKTKTKTGTEIAGKESTEIRTETVKIEGIEIMRAKGDPKTIVR